MMEVSSRMFYRAEGMCYISGFNVGIGYNSGLMISHLLFFYDTIQFCDVKREQI